MFSLLSASVSTSCPSRVEILRITLFSLIYMLFYLRSGETTWATDGCESTATEDDKITCHCDHTTNFAVLMQVKDVAVRFINYTFCLYLYPLVTS